MVRRARLPAWLPEDPRRLATLLIAGVCALAALVVAAFVSVPYVALTPGPTLNTLAKPYGSQLIQITGDKAAPGLWMTFAAACGLVATLLVYRRGEEQRTMAAAAA